MSRIRTTNVRSGLKKIKSNAPVASSAPASEKSRTSDCRGKGGRANKRMDASDSVRNGEQEGGAAGGRDVSKMHHRFDGANDRRRLLTMQRHAMRETVRAGGDDTDLSGSTGASWTSRSC